MAKRHPHCQPFEWLLSLYSRNITVLVFSRSAIYQLLKKKKTTIITTSDWQKGNQTSHPKVVSPQITSPKICAWVIVKRHYPGKAKTAAYIQVKKQLKLIWGEMIFTLFLVFKTKLLKQHIWCFAGPGANKLQSVTKLPRKIAGPLPQLLHSKLSCLLFFKCSFWIAKQHCSEGVGRKSLPFLFWNKKNLGETWEMSLTAASHEIIQPQMVGTCEKHFTCC